MSARHPSNRLRAPESLVFHGELSVPPNGFEWIDAIPPDPRGDIGASRRRIAPDGTAYTETTREKFDGLWGLDRYLVSASESAVPWRAYQTDDWPALFRSFGDLEVSEPAIADFAGKFGEVATGHVVHVGKSSHGRGRLAEAERDDKGRPILRIGNSVRLWRQEILGMKHALRVWDALQGGKSGQAILKGCFRVLTHRPYGPYAVNIEYQPDLGGGLTHGCFAPNGDPDNDYSPHKGAFVFHGFFGSDDTISVTGMALAFLATLVGCRLELPLFVSPTLVARGGDADPNGLRLQLRPTGVGGVAWLQLARAIEGNCRYLRCPRCHRWLAVSPQAGRRAKRADARYCSPTCRAAAGKQRRERALVLAARRMAPKRIAERLGTSVEQIRKWMGEAGSAGLKP